MCHDHNDLWLNHFFLLSKQIKIWRTWAQILILFYRNSIMPVCYDVNGILEEMGNVEIHWSIGSSGLADQTDRTRQRCWWGFLVQHEKLVCGVLFVHPQD